MDGHCDSRVVFATENVESNFVHQSVNDNFNLIFESNHVLKKKHWSTLQTKYKIGFVLSKPYSMLTDYLMSSLELGHYELFRTFETELSINLFLVLMFTPVSRCFLKR